MNYQNSARVAAICLLMVSVLCTGCDPAGLASLGSDIGGADSSTEPVGGPAGNETVIIGSFNIQSFGRAKMEKSDVVPILVDIVRRFDVIAIQELRDIDQRVIPEFLALINQGGGRFVAEVGPRQGYYVQKDQRRYEEQMVFIYDSSRVELIQRSYVAVDASRKMHRSPLVARFRSLGVPQSQAFTFSLMNVHVDYDDAIAEFKLMESILAGVYNQNPDEDDFILLGDMNGEPNTFNKFNWMSNQFAAIPNHWNTNTAQSENYDNIVFDAARTSEFMNQAGVMSLMAEYQIPVEQAKRVSDHLPVWAVFSARESVKASLTQGTPQVIR